MSHRTPSATALQDPGLTGFTSIPNVVHALVRSPREYQLVAALLSFRWYSSSPIIPSVKRLADMLDCGERTVRRTAASLEARGLIRRVERRAADTRQMSNLYEICGALLTAVAEIETGRARERRQAWPGRRSNVADKETQGNQTKRNQRSEGRYTPPDRYLVAPGGGRVNH